MLNPEGALFVACICGGVRLSELGARFGALSEGSSRAWNARIIVLSGAADERAERASRSG